jgi:hypothetical protein
MGVTIEQASRELAHLKDALDAGHWSPSGLERACARSILEAAAAPSADAIVAGVRDAGPDMAQPGGDLLAKALVRCAAAMRQTPGGSDRSVRLGQELRAVLTEVTAG